MDDKTAIDQVSGFGYFFCALVSLAQFTLNNKAFGSK